MSVESWLVDEALADPQGTYITPIKVQALELAAGQRYSVLITTQDKPSKKE
jgi:FtsP/CotA-like multicopper oxidase with cupredoxin domain